jgi:hypothetical protein
MYYNREAGPIPAGNQLVFKAGINGWETIIELEMRCAYA